MIACSLFSGIGAPETAMPHWDWPWHAEIEKFPSAVMAARHPRSVNLGDVTADDFAARATRIAIPDVLVFGSPCQDFSVAGRRAGLTGSRGNLSIVALDIIKELKPRFLVFENVPGLVSLDDGDGLRFFLDRLEDMGYIIDIDILDAQFFGLAQRRRRIFVCGQAVESILTKRTLSSALTLVQCVAEILLLSLAVLSGQSKAELENCHFDASRPLDSLQRRMRLLDLRREERVLMLLGSLGEIRRWCGCERVSSASPPGNNSQAASKTFGGTKCHTSTGETGLRRGEFRNTESSWKACLAEGLRIANECITLTASSGTTDQKIYSCAIAMLHITAHITQSQDCSPVFWSAASSSLMAIRGFTNYARQASSDLFTDVEWIHAWGDFVREAERAEISLGNLRFRSFDKIFTISESLCGDSPPRREAGKGTAPTLAARTKGGGGLGTDFDCDGGLSARTLTGSMGRRNGQPNDDNPADYLIASTLEATASRSRGAGTPTGMLAYEAIENTLEAGGHSRNPLDETLIAHTLRADGVDASEDGTGRGTPIVPIQCNGSNVGTDLPSLRRGNGHMTGGVPAIAIPFDTTQITSKENRCQPQAGDPCHPIPAHGHAPAIAFNPKAGGKQTNIGFDAASGTCGTISLCQTPAITGSAVRRLTPRECERLQGFPDDFTLVSYRGKPASDGPRYRSLGNSMAVPCVRWILARIEAIDGQRGSA